MSSPTRNVHFGRRGGMRYQGRFLESVGGSQLMYTGVSTRAARSATLAAPRCIAMGWPGTVRVPSGKISRVSPPCSAASAAWIMSSVGALGM